MTVLDLMVELAKYDLWAEVYGARYGLNDGTTGQQLVIGHVPEPYVWPHPLVIVRPIDEIDQIRGRRTARLDR